MGSAFRCKLREFSISTATEKLGHLIRGAAASGFNSMYLKQAEAWDAEFKALDHFCRELMASIPESRDWWLLFEYEIPLRDRRPDVVMLAGDLIFVLEFKAGAEVFHAADQWQATSYALDLRDFHAQSRDRRIIPLLVATNAPAGKCEAAGALPEDREALVLPVHRANVRTLAGLVASIYRLLPHGERPDIDAVAWDNSAYRPTPTIIEAAEQLFAGHSVANISHAFATNLNVTTEAIVQAVTASQRQKRRTICFVTGTPGAGKTLTGLNAAHNPDLRRDGRPAAMFLSGNGPLVKIVKEALIRDRVKAGASKKDAEHVVRTFVANVHAFLVQYGIKAPKDEPAQHAVIFDEAQRAWHEAAVQKKHSINASEPALLLQIMERAPEWSTIIALVGGGQEIHQGEAGLEEWGRALTASQGRWRVMASPELLHGGDSVTGNQLFRGTPPENLELIECPSLHLAVSVRSPRARLLGQWVDGLLNNQPAASGAQEMNAEFPLVITRDLKVARQWLRERSDGHQRAGLLASSGALRLRAFGIEVSAGFRQGYSYTDWFLNGPEDTRSSMQLEVAATEFECQGLELDWTGVCWGGDFLLDPASGRWMARAFRGTLWQKVSRPEARRYILNKYRVLLTRARRGMIIWVPRGDSRDSTQAPALLDATAAYLADAGIPIV